MRKRVIYLLIAVSFVITTISQAFIPAYAQTITSNSSSHLSKVINYQKIFTNTNSVESVLASTNQKQSVSTSQSGSTSKVTNKQSSKKGTAQITPRAESHSTLSLDKDSAAVDELITLTVTPTPVGTETDTNLMASTLKVPSFLSYQVDDTNKANGISIAKLIKISNPDANGVLTISPLKNDAATNYFRKNPFKIVFKVIEDGDGALQLVDKASPTVVNSNKIAVTGASIKGDEFADGITWNQPTNVTKVGFTEFTQNPSAGLKYGLGNLQDPEDPTIDTGMNQKLDVHGPGQMNIAIKEPNDNLIKMYFGGLNHAPDQIERTSMGFGVVFDSSMTGGGAELKASSASLSILANQLKHKKYFTGTDSNGHLVMKEMGYFNRIDLTDPNKIHKLLVEILLRPSTTGPATVQQEMFIKNISGKPDSMGVMLGQDTMLGEQGSDDFVPIKSIGDDQGLYIESKDQNYKLLIKMDTPNGPSDFSAAVGAPVFFYNWLSGFGGTFAGQGDKAKGNTKKANSTLLKDEDTGYVSKWDWMTLQNNEIQHFRNDVIGIYGPVVTPISKKNFVNLTHPAGPNKVGDKIKYELQTTNSGFKDSWQNVTFTDSVPETLKVDDSTIELTIDDYISAADAAAGKGTEGETKIYTAKVPASAYDATHHKLTVKIGDLKDDKGKAIPADLGDNDSAHITFESQILKTASNSKVKNHFDVTGTDAKNTDSNGDPLVVKDGVDNEFEVEEDLTPEPDFAMTKQVRNVTKNETAFKNTTAAAASDKVQYQIEATADATENLKNAVIKDALDADLTADKVQVQYQNTDGTWGALTTVTFDSDGKLTLTNPVLANKKVRILIDATVSATTKKTKIDNQAQLVGGSYNITGDNTKSNVAELTITAKQVDFSKLEQTISNKTTPANDENDSTTHVATKTSGKMGDKIQYQFRGETKTGNTEDIKKAVVENIHLSQTDALSFDKDSLKVVVDGTNKTLTDPNIGADNKVAVADTVKTSFTVTYTMTIKINIDKEILNDGDLTASNLDTTRHFNTTTIKIVPQKNTATIVQSIYNTKTATWGDETNAKPGDTVDYKYRINAPKANQGGLVDAQIQEIVMAAANQLTYKTGTLKISVYTGDNLATSESVTDLTTKHLVKLIKELKPDQNAEVKYSMTVNADAASQDVTNNAKFTAPNLGSTMDFNPTTVHILSKRQVKLHQTLKDETTEDTTTTPAADAQGYREKTQAAKDDLIKYRFEVNAADDNDGDIKNMIINNIVLNPLKDAKNNDSLVFQAGSLEVDGTALGTAAEKTLKDDHKIVISKTLAKKQSVTVTYEMKVVSDVVGLHVTNDADFSADSLTDSTGKLLPTSDKSGKTIPQMSFNQTELNTINNIGKIIIRYVDLDEDLSDPDNAPTKIADKVEASGEAGKALSTVVSERVAPKVIDGYAVMAVSEEDDLVTAPKWARAYKDDPIFTNKVRTITYGYKKKMIAVEAPNYWDFGHYNKTQMDSTYYLDSKKTPQQVTVTDNYGVDSWQLQVQQKQPFTDDRKQVLKDAQLRFTNGNVTAEASNTAPSSGIDSIPSFNLNPGDTVTDLMTYTKSGVFQKEDINKDKSNVNNRYNDDQGEGIWHYRFGDNKSADNSIGLYVPGTTKRDTTKYTTVLDWTLTVAP